MTHPPNRHEQEETQRREALEALERLRRGESDTFAGSALARAAQRAADHFSAKDAIGADDGATDPIELWGRRIGRALGGVFFVGLCIYLYLKLVR